MQIRIHTEIEGSQKFTMKNWFSYRRFASFQQTFFPAQPETLP
jgi:hypothetical protein